MTTETDIGPVGAVHVPVMVAEVVEWLRPRPGARLVDATVGLGGHAAALLAAVPATSLLGLDRDPTALEIARARLQDFGDRVTLRQGNFAALATVLDELGWGAVDGVLLDLGVSSLQLEDPGRGFSFRAAGPLDMRMDPGAGDSADQIVNAWPEQDLARLIAEYGEERRARQVARAIVRARPLRTTADLADTIARAVRARGSERLHPATRTFQAIRIAVNEEIAALDQVLAEGWALLRPGGRLAVLAYHSLEDRPVKAAVRRWAADCLCPAGTPRCTCGWTRKVRLLARRPLRPSPEEVARNPRARSARLRIVERVGTEAK